MGRSAFFQRAAEAYVERLEAESFTAEYDAALARLGEDATLPDVLAHNLWVLAQDEEEW